MKQPILFTVQCGKKSRWYQGKVIMICLITAALFSLTACTQAAMETCQETHSFETCVYTLK